MGGPCAALGQFFMDDNRCSWYALVTRLVIRGPIGSVVFVHSVELSVSQHSGVESGLSEEVECRHRLRNELIP
jgi:hypothetical protein